MTEQNPVEVYRARDTAHAYLLASALEAAGIRARVDGEYLQGALGDLPLGWSTSPRVLVAEADAAQARTILERTEHGAPDG
jgi:hypothetical protein